MTAEQEALAASVQLSITNIVSMLVDDGFVTTFAPDDLGGTTIKVSVVKQDIGKVIGKQGRTAKALRTILCAASAKYGHKFMLDIQELA